MTEENKSKEASIRYQTTRTPKIWKRNRRQTIVDLISVVILGGELEWWLIGGIDQQLEEGVQA